MDIDVATPRAPWLLKDRLRERGGLFRAGPPCQSHVVADGTLGTRGKAAANETEVRLPSSAERIRGEVQGSKVILRVTVRSWAEKAEAERVAWSAPGVTAVENHITVEP